MIAIKKYTVQSMLESVCAEYGDIPGLNFAGSNDSTYTDLLADVQRISAWLLACEFFPGDKIAILGENSPNWGSVWLGINRCGCITVPILPDFSNNEVENILTHSEVKGLFISKRLSSKMEGFSPDKSMRIFSLDTLETISGEYCAAADFAGSDGKHDEKEDDIATIIYTSGTTGQSKGVMLTNKNLIWNAESAVKIPKLRPGYKIISILPLSHTYEFTIGFLTLMISGTSFYYLKKPPSASVLLPALAKIRPQLMISVPLLIEKIYRQNVLPKLTKGGIVTRIYRTAPGRKILNRLAGKKLKRLFGGRLVFFGVGGAPLAADVEAFLREAKFPYAIGYGLTETSPLIAGSNPKNTVPQGIGPVLPGLELDIRDKNPETGVGTVFVKGPSVMKGYYKDPERTRDVLSEDGWFNTGDLGIFDSGGNLYIKGRAKTMILGPSGENIFPESIEAMIDSFDFVEESLVLEEQGGLVARIRVNYEDMAEHVGDLAGRAGEAVKNASDHTAEFLEQLKKDINSQLSRFSRIGKVMEQKEPFVRTPTKKIKRYIYQALHHGEEPPEEN